MAEIKVWALVHGGVIPANLGNLYVFDSKEAAENNPDCVVNDSIVSCTLSWEDTNG
jgi:hypothetical protein